MSSRRGRRESTLEERVSAVLRQACREREFGAADHLLRALEILAERPDGMGGASTSACLDHAYLGLRGETGSKPRTPRRGRPARGTRH